MKIAKNQVPVKLQVPGAIARLQPGFGDTTRYGTLSAEYFSLAAGTDIAPLLTGLHDDLCQAPHWGYLVEGSLSVTYGDGSVEQLQGGDMFYWPPGHTVKVGADAELVMFSPQKEHLHVLDHMRMKLGV